MLPLKVWFTVGVEDFEYQEEIWDHDDFWINQNEADDYRSEGEDPDEPEDNPEPWEAEQDWERDD